MALRYVLMFGVGAMKKTSVQGLELAQTQPTYHEYINPEHISMADGRYEAWNVAFTDNSSTVSSYSRKSHSILYAWQIKRKDFAELKSNFITLY